MWLRLCSPTETTVFSSQKGFMKFGGGFYKTSQAYLLCSTSVVRSTHLVLEFPVDIVGEVVGVLWAWKQERTPLWLIIGWLFEYGSTLFSRMIEVGLLCLNCLDNRIYFISWCLVVEIYKSSKIQSQSNDIHIREQGQGLMHAYKIFSFTTVFTVLRFL